VTSASGPGGDGPGAAGPAATTPDLVLDCLGQRCPLPVIALARAVSGLPAGAVIRVLADDPAAANDIPAWCRMRGQEYAGATAVDGAPAYDVRAR
jgi:tRNA 2-thiouridine synthesizing protein A